MRQLPIFAALLLFAACSSLRPQTGDVSFRLRWDGKADLDLHVVDPGGGHVGLPFLHASVGNPGRTQFLLAELEAGRNPDGKTTGILDIDCNSDIANACAKPIENIFWALGSAPRGAYQVWAELFQQVEGSGGVPYVLEIRRGEKVVQRLTGSLGPSQRKSEVATYAY
jgi:hypothetical protein